MNEQLMQDPNIQLFIESINNLKNLDDSLFTDETVNSVLDTIESAFSKEQMNQSINTIIQNLEAQNASRNDAHAYVQALKELINEIIYGDEILTGNKRTVIDKVAEKINNTFDTAVEKYHSYAIELPIKLENGATVPTYAHETDAAADLYALEDTDVNAHTYGNKIRTGVSIQLPEGWLAMILPRSSTGAKTPLRLSNSVGLIDSGYRGELGVLYDNTSDNDTFIKKGDRIAQLLVMPSYRFQAQVVDSLEDSDRGEGGFGSTGQ